MKKYIVMLTALVLSGIVAFAADGQKFNTADTAPAMRVYNGGSESVSIVIATGGASANNYVLIGTTSNNIDGSGATYDDVGEFASAIAACTNSSGKKVLTVDTDCAVALTESTDDNLLDGTTVILPGNWGDVKWDTSLTLNYRVYIPANNVGPKRGGVTVKSIYGDPTGTGNVTVKGYIDRNLVFQSTVVSPTYVPALMAATNTLNAVVTIDIPTSLYVGANQALIIEAARVTTATTGGLGITYDAK